MHARKGQVVPFAEVVPEKRQQGWELEFDKMMKEFDVDSLSKVPSLWRENLDPKKTDDGKKLQKKLEKFERELVKTISTDKKARLHGIGDFRKLIKKNAKHFFKMRRKLYTEALFSAPKSAASPALLQILALLRRLNDYLQNLYGKTFSECVLDSRPEKQQLEELEKLTHTINDANEETLTQTTNDFVDALLEAYGLFHHFEKHFQKVAQRCNGDFQNANLKSAFRASEQIQLTPIELADGNLKIYDILRGTIVFASLEEIVKCIKFLKQDSQFKIVRIKNRFSDDGKTEAHWRDVVINGTLNFVKTGDFDQPSRHIVEIQLHHAEFQKFRNDKHGGQKIYTQARMLTEALQATFGINETKRMIECERDEFEFQEKIRMDINNLGEDIKKANDRLSKLEQEINMAKIRLEDLQESLDKAREDNSSNQRQLAETQTRAEKQTDEWQQKEKMLQQAQEAANYYQELLDRMDAVRREGSDPESSLYEELATAGANKKKHPLEQCQYEMNLADYSKKSANDALNEAKKKCHCGEKLIKRLEEDIAKTHNVLNEKEKQRNEFRDKNNVERLKQKRTKLQETLERFESIVCGTGALQATSKAAKKVHETFIEEKETEPTLIDQDKKSAAASEKNSTTSDVSHNKKANQNPKNHTVRNILIVALVLLVVGAVVAFAVVMTDCAIRNSCESPSTTTTSSSTTTTTTTTTASPLAATVTFPSTCNAAEADYRYHDSLCDTDLNVGSCNWDGGDCCETTCSCSTNCADGCITINCCGTIFDYDCKDPEVGTDIVGSGGDDEEVAVTTITVSVLTVTTAEQQNQATSAPTTTAKQNQATSAPTTTTASAVPSTTTVEQQIPTTLASSCNLEYHGDGYCDGDENVADCGWDGGDCCEDTCACEENCYAQCGEDVPYNCHDECVTSYHGDGYCDEFQNKEQCGWDGGDCCRTTCSCVENCYAQCGDSFFVCLDPNAPRPQGSS